jgi:hypothetical protein
MKAICTSKGNFEGKREDKGGEEYNQSTLHAYKKKVIMKHIKSCKKDLKG